MPMETDAHSHLDVLRLDPSNQLLGDAAFPSLANTIDFGSIGDMSMGGSSM
jgi:hypothetical protein